MPTWEDYQQAFKTHGELSASQMWRILRIQHDDIIVTRVAVDLQVLSRMGFIRRIDKGRRTVYTTGESNA